MLYVYWKKSVVVVMCNGNLNLVLCDHFFVMDMSFGNIVGAKRK